LAYKQRRFISAKRAKRHAIGAWIRRNLSHVFQMAAWTRWVRPEVYPIVIAVGGACGLRVFHLQRHLFCSPDVRLMKSERALGVLEEKHFHKEGAAFRDHSVRRFFAAKEAQIFPATTLFVLLHAPRN